jgi:hypothetical protein
VPASFEPAPTDKDRERYLRLLDGALSRGLLGDGDYMLRADAIQQASSIEEMNTIVQQLPVLENPTKTRATASAGSRRRRTDEQVEPPLTIPSIEQTIGPDDDLSKLDPVDVAMLMRSREVRKPSPNRRMQALAVVGILFLVLIVVGVLLAIHDKQANGSGGPAPLHLVVSKTLEL